MLDTADVTRQFLQAIIQIIGRKTSEEYAAVTIRNLIKKLQPTYPFLQDIEIKNTRSLELESNVTVRDSLNTIHPKEVGMALKELAKIIIKFLGKNAGYFFIRETQEKIGKDYDTMLVKTMDVDLTLMQSTYIVEKKSIALLHIEKSDVMRRFLKALMEALEKQTSKTFAIGFTAQRIEALRQQYTFLEYVSVNDIRYTLGSEEVAVQLEINNVDPRDLGRAIESILQDTDTALIDLGRNSVADDLKTHLTLEYLAKLEEMGVTIIAHGVGYEAIFKQLIKALIDILGKTSTENYAISAVNSFLRKIDSTYEFLKYVKVDSATNEGELYHITITNNINSISETDARRAIQQLLETIMESLEEKVRNEFIQKFKNSLEKKYLLKIEEMGVNFHMIELHQEMLNQR
ncbi:MAG: hypothetical protein MUO73_07605 [Thermoplasmata archaeon]|nr:hypothetical protein [Thermoplasmata archaeon]